MKVLTEWYPCDAKPERPGWYLTRSGPDDYGVQYLLLWDGHWCWDDDSLVEVQDRQWRGLTFDPTAAVCSKRLSGSSDVWVVKVTR